MSQTKTDRGQKVMVKLTIQCSEDENEGVIVFIMQLVKSASDSAASPALGRLSRPS